MNEEPSKMCQNCQRDIPSGNFQMHAMHCQRNIQLCPKCQEPVPRLELAKHDAESHSNVYCPECRISLESSKLDEHKKNDCPKRHLLCQYCELELKADGIPEHEDYCGSRTECCDCGKLVMIKFQQMHLDSNHRQTKPDEEDTDSASDDDLVVTGRNFTHDASRGNIAARQMDLDFEDHFQYLDLNRARDATRFRPNQPEREVPFVQPDYQQWRQEQTMIPCEFCETHIVADQLILHQTGCRPDLLSYNSTNTRPERADVRHARRINPVNGHRESRNGKHQQQEENVLIPCEFCQKPFSLDYLDTHQATCQNTA